MKHVFSILICILLISTLAGPVSGSLILANQEIDFEAVDAFVARQMKKHNLPGVALAITIGEEQVFAKGYGRARQTAAMTPDTPLYIGSLTKSFTALAIMQLVEKGQIDLDAPVRTYLPDFRIKDTQASEIITIRNLLHHTSGLSELGYTPRHPDDLGIQEGVLALAAAELTAPVGSTFQYFNPNYDLLGAVVEAVSGMSYERYIGENIFVPLRMHNSYTRPQPAMAAGLAQGYRSVFSFSLPLEQAYRPYSLPSGYLMMSVNDLSRYLMAQLHDGHLDDAQVLSAQNVIAMHTPPASLDVPYGMGWFVDQKNGYQIIEHGGTNENFHTSAMLIPELDMTVAILVNKNSLLNAMFGNPQLDDGILNLVIPQPVTDTGISMRLVGLLMLAGFVLNLAFSIRSIVRLKDWQADYLKQNSIARFWNVGSHFIISIILIILIPIFIEGYLQRGFTWKIAFESVPDGMLWFASGVVLDFVNGILKIGLISKSAGTIEQPLSIK